MVLQLTQEYCQKGGTVVDLGASPFIISCALKLMGYEVIACDYDPWQYLNIAEAFNVEVFKCDLERDSLNIPSGSADCVVLSEVMEHLNPYYISHLLAEVNRISEIRRHIHNNNTEYSITIPKNKVVGWKTTSI